MESDTGSGERKPVDELKLKRMKKCAESREGHYFEEFDDRDECEKCGLTISREQ